jgi:hypothetical protein
LQVFCKFFASFLQVFSTQTWEFTNVWSKKLAFCRRCSLVEDFRCSATKWVIRQEQHPTDLLIILLSQTQVWLETWSAPYLQFHSVQGDQMSFVIKSPKVYVAQPVFCQN